MKIALVQTGKTTDKNVAGIADLYLSRIKKYSAFEIITLPDIKNSGTLSVQEQKIGEGEKIIRVLSIDDYVVLLDERGYIFKVSCHISVCEHEIGVSHRSGSEFVLSFDVIEDCVSVVS